MACHRLVLLSLAALILVAPGGSTPTTGALPPLAAGFTTRRIANVTVHSAQQICRSPARVIAARTLTSTSTWIRLARDPNRAKTIWKRSHSRKLHHYRSNSLKNYSSDGAYPPQGAESFWYGCRIRPRQKRFWRYTSSGEWGLYLWCRSRVVTQNAAEYRRQQAAARCNSASSLKRHRAYEQLQRDYP